MVLRTTYKRPVCVRYEVSAADKTAGQIFIQLDKNPEVEKDWYMGLPWVRSSTGTVKTGFTWTYHSTGSDAGYLEIANGSDSLEENDLIDIQGSLNLV